MLLEELVERTIFHLFRIEVVNRGYLPDILTYDIQNTDNTIAKAENLRYNVDLKAIYNTKGFAIEVFNYSNNQAYGDKNIPRIVVQTESFLPGNLGLDPTAKYVKQTDGSFSRVKSTEMVSDYYFNINLLANTTKQIRELHDIMVNVLPRRGYVKRYDDNELRPHSNLLIQYLSSSDVSYLAEGIIEKVYRYMIPDVHEIDDKVLPGIISSITDVMVDDENNENIIKLP